MSHSTALATRPAVRAAPSPAGRTANRSPAPRLRVVSAPVHARSRAGLVVASLVVLAVGLVGLLLLNVSLEKGAFVRRGQLEKIEQLTEQRQALQEQIAALEAPQSLASRAASLGMVEAPNVAFVQSNGRILGVPSPGVAVRPAIVTPSGSSAGGYGAATGPAAGASTSVKGPLAGVALPAGKASTKVTAAGKAAATTTAASSRKPASSAAATKAPAPAASTSSRSAKRTGATKKSGAAATAAVPATP